MVRYGVELVISASAICRMRRRMSVATPPAEAPVPGSSGSRTRTSRTFRSARRAAAEMLRFPMQIARAIGRPRYSPLGGRRGSRKSGSPAAARLLPELRVQRAQKAQLVGRSGGDPAGGRVTSQRTIGHQCDDQAPRGTGSFIISEVRHHPIAFGCIRRSGKG